MLANRQNSTYLFAPAKINIGLSIIGRREDGFHFLESLFWPIDYCDTIEIQTGAEKTPFSALWAEDAPFPQQCIPQGDKNLLSQTLIALSSKITVQHNVLLMKKIPIGAGLGGGSSDAGTFLRYFLSRYPSLKAFIHELSLKLGADIPFFLNPDPSWIFGIGEKRRGLKTETSLIKNIYFLLVFPPFPIYTKDIFEALRQNGKLAFSSPKTFFPGNIINKDLLVSYLSEAKNDLEPVVVSRHPLIGQLLDNLRNCSPAYAGLSGSGSTCFAIYFENKSLQKSLKVLSPFFRKHKCKSASAHTFTGSK